MLRGALRKGAFLLEVEEGLVLALMSAGGGASRHQDAGEVAVSLTRSQMLRHLPRARSSSTQHGLYRG